jgi:hypothetical protein
VALSNAARLTLGWGRRKRLPHLARLRACTTPRNVRPLNCTIT